MVMEVSVLHVSVWRVAVRLPAGERKFLIWPKSYNFDTMLDALIQF